MQIHNITAISNLNSYKIKGCKYDGIEDKDGTIYQKSEAGEEFNIVRWIEHSYTLSLQYLTFEEAENIINQFILAKRNRKLASFSKNIIINKGYIDFKEAKGEPHFYFEVKDIKPKQNKKFYDLTIKLKERVDYL